MKDHQTVNTIFVQTTLLNACQSNYSYTEKNKILNHITGIHQTQLYSDNVVESGQVFNRHIALLGHTAAKGKKAHKNQHGPNSQSVDIKWQQVFCPINSCRVSLKLRVLVILQTVIDM